MSSKIGDPARLDAVRRSAMVGSANEPIFDELTKAAARLMRAPYALISIMGDTESYWKSTFGLPATMRTEPVTESFCQYVVERGEDLLTEDVTQNEITKHNPTIEAKGLRAWAGTAVELDGQPLGTFCVIDREVRTWTDEDHEILRSLAAIASHEIQLRSELAVTKDAAASARNESDRVRSLLDTLRASLLPPRLPTIAGLELATWFEAAAGGDMLLGDFYDVFPLGEGRWSIVVGDVCGHGVEAARLTSLVRYSLRSAALHHDDPAEIMAEVDRAIRLDELDVGRFATVCYFEIDTRSELAIRWARAGHPYPVLITADGTTRLLEGADGPPLGIGLSSGWTVGSLELEVGHTILLYTDGLTESRVNASDDRFGDAGLLDLISRSHALTAGKVEALTAELGVQLQQICSTRDDDCAVIAFSAVPGL